MRVMLACEGQLQARASLGAPGERPRGIDNFTRVPWRCGAQLGWQRMDRRREPWLSATRSVELGQLVDEESELLRRGKQSIERCGPL